MKYNKKQAIKIVTQAAKKYEEFLRGKHFLILFEKSDGTVDYVQLSFKNNNFKHLTGIQTKLTAIEFYDMSRKGRLSENDIDISSSGRTQSKLVVLPYLHSLLYDRCMIGISLNGGIYIDTEYFVGNSKTYLSAGFRSLNEIGIPVTLYNEDIRKLTSPTYKVAAIFRKEYYEKKYGICTFESKDFQFDNLDDKIKSMIEIYHH